MRNDKFKQLMEYIKSAPEKDPIWYAGFAFMSLTPKQHERVYETCCERGFKVVVRYNQFNGFEGVELPSGLVLLKGGSTC